MNIKQLDNNVYVEQIEVYCTECKEWMNEADTGFENIEEDAHGRDRLTFECLECNTIQKSYRVGK
jgi:RNase P subunit RPR2